MSPINEILEELKNTCDYIVQQYASIGISLDYTAESVKELDRIFDDEFKDGELVNPESNFAKREGFILTGIAAYLAEVFIKNSLGAKIEINDGDLSWYVNFKVTAANGWSVEPGQRVLKRKLEGGEANLYHYVVIMLQYFNDSKEHPIGSDNQISKISKEKKPWWKFW